MARTRELHSVDENVIADNAQGSPEKAIFAKTLNRLINEKGMHQEELANAVGVATGSISDYRNGKKEPRLTTIIKLADCLGVDCHYLLTGVQANNYSVTSDIGLSDDAISWLKEKKNNFPYLMEMINRLFEIDGLSDMLFHSMFEYCISIFSKVTIHDSLFDTSEDKPLSESEKILKFYAQEQYSAVLDTLRLSYSSYLNNLLNEKMETLKKSIKRSEEEIKGMTQYNKGEQKDDGKH